MKISKQGMGLPGGTPDDGQMAKINLQSKTALTPEEVYAFSVRLCDDQVDRDYERFDAGALETLGRLFVGKPGIVDHNWSAEKQVARIFDTEVVQEPEGSWLRGWAYIPRAGKEEVIRDIESGIRREVSISCSMGRKTCSICGGEMGTCGHVPGKHYEGELCIGILQEPQDAYEFSFVAVPAQPKAGVMKHWKGGESMNLKEYVEKSGLDVLKKELARLKALASYGEAQRVEKEQEFVRMGVALELGLSRKELEEVALGLEDELLEKFHKGLKKKMEQIHCGKSQLSADVVDKSDGEAYRI